MKVVHILNSREYSGAENVVIQIIKYSCQHNIEAYYVSPKGKIEERLKQEGIVYYMVDALNVYNIKKVIKKVNPDIIHAHDYTASIVSAISSQGIRVVSHLHNNTPWIKKYGWKTWAFFLSTCKYSDILYVSGAIEREYVFSKYIKCKKIVVGNPINLSIVEEKAKEKPTDSEKYHIVFIGRLAKQKRPDIFLDIIAEIVKEFPEIKACIMGNGELYPALIQKREELGINSNVSFLGFVENPYPILKNAKILLITSDWEGFGLVAIEALSLGKPVVSTQVGGLIDVVNNECGYLCKNKKELLLSCLKLLKNDKLYREKSNKALQRAKVMENYNYYMKKLERIYYG